MNEEEKKDVAVLRFGVVNGFICGVALERGEQERLLREKREKKWAIPPKHLKHITATLGVALIHARPYKPQGKGKIEKGKIERFFRTVRM